MFLVVRAFSFSPVVLPTRGWVAFERPQGSLEARLEVNHAESASDGRSFPQSWPVQSTRNFSQHHQDQPSHGRSFMAFGMNSFDQGRCGTTLEVESSVSGR